MKYVLILSLCLIGCQPRVNSGTIINKQFVPKHKETSYVMVGKVLIPQDYSVPDSWYFEVQDPTGRSVIAQVSKRRFYEYEIGEHYRVP